MNKLPSGAELCTYIILQTEGQRTEKQVQGTVGEHSPLFIFRRTHQNSPEAVRVCKALATNTNSFFGDCSWEPCCKVIVISSSLCVHVSARQDESKCVFLPGSFGISRICSRSSNICSGTRVVHVVPRCVAFTGTLFDLSCLSSSLSPIVTYLVQT